MLGWAQKEVSGVWCVRLWVGPRRFDASGGGGVRLRARGGVRTRGGVGYSVASSVCVNLGTFASSRTVLP